MCRIAALINLPTSLAKKVHRLQANGATRCAEIFTDRWERDGLERSVALIHSRYDVTTAHVPTGAFPYQEPNFIFHHNGEIFAFEDEAFVSSRSESDVHFAAKHFAQHGLNPWLSKLDFQGTIQLYDVVSRKLYVAVDQLNTQGGFYAAWDDKVVVAEEVAIVEMILRAVDAPSDALIYLIKGGCYLEISEDGLVRTRVYRKVAEEVFTGNGPFTDEDFKDRVHLFSKAFRMSVERRIPREGPVAVLCGGGVDSSYLLETVTGILRNGEALGRLIVFTLGSDSLPTAGEANDWVNAKELFNALDRQLGLRVAGARHVRINPDSEAVAALYREKIFCSGVARLITPNPVLNTQVRHAVRMSAVLEEIVRNHPDVRVVLSGDGADELFAGYNSMWETCDSTVDLRNHVVEKLYDLAINDCARVALASFHGVCSATKICRIKPYLGSRTGHLYRRLEQNLDHWTVEEIENYIKKHQMSDSRLETLLRSLHPVEIRTPFTSHLVLEALASAIPAYLVGEFDGKFCSKFLLRFAAYKEGLSAHLSSRKKIPFHEGGTGVRNADRFVVEQETASRHAPRGVEKWRNSYRQELKQLALDQDAQGGPSSDEQVLCFAKAMESGFARLLPTDAFRRQMPDCIYSTDDAGARYSPEYFLKFHSDINELTVAPLRDALFVKRRA